MTNRVSRDFCCATILPFCLFILPTITLFTRRFTLRGLCMCGEGCCLILIYYYCVVKFTLPTGSCKRVYLAELLIRMLFFFLIIMQKSGFTFRTDQFSRSPDL